MMFLKCPGRPGAPPPGMAGWLTHWRSAPSLGPAPNNFQCRGPVNPETPEIDFLDLDCEPLAGDHLFVKAKLVERLVGIFGFPLALASE